MVEFQKTQRTNSLISEYEISDLDTSGDPSYYGYITIDGKWYIKELNEANGTMRFIMGNSDFGTNWNNRRSLIYNRYN